MLGRPVFLHIYRELYDKHIVCSKAIIPQSRKLNYYFIYLILFYPLYIGWYIFLTSWYLKALYLASHDNIIGR